MDAADPGWRRLGVVLVEAGLVSEHDLVEALAEQERSGQRLGEVLVERGLVSAAAIANALAEQRGGFLKSEYGFGTGLRALMGRSKRPGIGRCATRGASFVAYPASRACTRGHPSGCR